jgi:hypothetical protein
MIGLQNYFKTLISLKAAISAPPNSGYDIDNLKHADVLKARYNWLQEAKSFYVDEEITKLLLLTKNKITFKRLPFNDIFIDTLIDLGKLQITGIHLLAATRLGKGTKFKIIGAEEGEDYDNISYFYFVKDKQKPEMIYYEYGMILSDEDLEQKYRKDIQQRIDEGEPISFDEAVNAAKNIKIFTMNFLDLLNNPEVEIVSRKPNEERNIKRIGVGKQIIPTRHFVVVKGKIKEYIEQMKTGKHFSYGHRFWVRGFFRTYEDDKFVNMKGKKKWVMPFLKGSGLLIEKVRVVK